MDFETEFKPQYLMKADLVRLKVPAPALPGGNASEVIEEDGDEGDEDEHVADGSDKDASASAPAGGGRRLLLSTPSKSLNSKNFKTETTGSASKGKRVIVDWVAASKTTGVKDQDK
jgi:hypothetical protein